jgi:hypothetical protein
VGGVVDEIEVQRTAISGAGIGTDVLPCGSLAPVAAPAQPGHQDATATTLDGLAEELAVVQGSWESVTALRALLRYQAGV